MVRLVYAWAADQRNGRSGHNFASPDVFVPFHQRLPTQPPPATSAVQPPLPDGAMATALGAGAVGSAGAAVGQ